MKFNPLSSSSTSSTSFSANLGCFSGFLSKILCSKTLPTYPSYETENRHQFSSIEKVVDGSGTPNVVARLMGLEFMPEISSKDDKTWNSGDFRAETEDMQGKNRRVKMSFSFTEAKNYFEIEEDGFFVLSFENGDEKKKKVSNLGEKKRKKCRRKQRMNRDEQGKNRVFSDEERGSLGISPQNFEKIDVGFDARKTKTKTKSKKMENFMELSEMEENYSPVSVLDDSEFVSSDYEVTLSSNSEEEAKSRGHDECDKEQPSSSNEMSNFNDTKTEENEEKRVLLLRRKNSKKYENLEIMKKVYRFAEEEFNHSENWKYYRGMFCAHEFEETVFIFSVQIFEQLINELIDQLIDI